MTKYLKQVRGGVLATTGCKVTYVETVPVKELFKGQTAWEGNVEVFDLIGHPKAKRSYAWGILDEKGVLEITNVLEIPPVTSAETAVRVAIAASARI